jgi:hypothetical protein
VIDVGPLHLLEELAGVDRKALHVLPMAFGQERVEGERALAGAADAGDHHELVAWNIDVDVLQVVRASSADLDGIGHVELYAAAS